MLPKSVQSLLAQVVDVEEEGGRCIQRGFLTECFFTVARLTSAL